MEWSRCSSYCGLVKYCLSGFLLHHPTLLIQVVSDPRDTRLRVWLSNEAYYQRAPLFWNTGIFSWELNCHCLFFFHSLLFLHFYVWWFCMKMLPNHLKLYPAASQHSGVKWSHFKYMIYKDGTLNSSFEHHEGGTHAAAESCGLEAFSQRYQTMGHLNLEWKDMLSHTKQQSWWWKRLFFCLLHLLV